MNRLKHWIMAAALLAPAVTVADATEEANALVKQTVDSVLLVLRDKSIQRPVKRDRIMSIITPVFDFDSMAMLTLGRRHWPSLNAEQRREFTDLFVKQLQDTYFDKAEIFSEEKVSFDAPVLQKDKVHVNTKVISKDEQIAMKYKLYKSSTGWRVYDIEVEGVSIVSSYRSQYDQILQSNSVEELLRRMREKSLALNSKD